MKSRFTEDRFSSNLFFPVTPVNIGCFAHSGQLMSSSNSRCNLPNPSFLDFYAIVPPADLIAFIFSLSRCQELSFLTIPLFIHHLCERR